MRPTRQLQPPGFWPALGALGLGGVILALLFSPYDEPDAHVLFLDPRPAAEIVALIASLAFLALARVPFGRIARWLVAVVVFVALLLHLVDAAMPSLFGRNLELYWDLRHLPSIAGMLLESAGLWRTLAAFAVAALVAATMLAIVAGSIALLARGLQHRRVAAGAAFISLALLGATALVPDEPARPLALHATGSLGHHVATFYRAWQIATGRDNPYSAALAAPQLDQPDLARLAGRDVYLIFFESYGTVVLDRPDFAAALAPAFARFEASAARAGMTLLSQRILSPTYGGGSWLAHGTLASGVRVTDQFFYRLLTGGDRKTLPRYMQEAGYRTVDLLPGVRTPFASTRFWGFEKSLYAADMGYTGPEFGWFRIPDQVTLRRAAEFGASGDGRPLFLRAVLVSSHTPFAPVPPYVADWNDAGDYSSVSAAEWERVYAQPDWSHLERPYLDSVAYVLDTLGGWLEKLPRDALVVILGDHQPPAFVSGAKQPWTVPIHVLARDPQLLAPFKAMGYTPGAQPMQRAPWARMAEFMHDFFTAASRNPPVASGEAPPAGHAN
jgi:hypothetical protein